jgi:hypothetical protein
MQQGISDMNDDSWPSVRGYGVLPSRFDDPATLPWSSFNSNHYDPTPGALVGYGLAAISRDAPVKDAPVTLPNPFDWSQSTFGDLQNRYLWNKLMFDSRLLPTNPFFSSDSNRTPQSNFLAPTPMNPLEGAPILPPQFR